MYLYASSNLYISYLKFLQLIPNCALLITQSAPFKVIVYTHILLENTYHIQWTNIKDFAIAENIFKSLNMFSHRLQTLHECESMFQQFSCTLPNKYYRTSFFQDNNINGVLKMVRTKYISLYELCVYGQHVCTVNIKHQCVAPCCH